MRKYAIPDDQDFDCFDPTRAQHETREYFSQSPFILIDPQDLALIPTPTTEEIKADPAALSITDRDYTLVTFTAIEWRADQGKRFRFLRDYNTCYASAVALSATAAPPITITPPTDEELLRMREAELLRRNRLGSGAFSPAVPLAETSDPLLFDLRRASLGLAADKHRDPSQSRVRPVSVPYQTASRQPSDRHGARPAKAQPRHPVSAPQTPGNSHRQPVFSPPKTE